MKKIFSILVLCLFLVGCSENNTKINKSIDQKFLSLKDEMTLEDAVSFKWDKAYTFDFYTDSEHIEKTVGINCKGAQLLSGDCRLVVFVNDNKLVHNYYTEKIGFFPPELHLSFGNEKFNKYPLDSDTIFFQLENESVSEAFQQIKPETATELKDIIPFKYDKVFMFPQKIPDKEIEKEIGYYEETKMWIESEGLFVFEVSGILQYYNFYYDKNKFDFQFNELKVFDYDESCKLSAENKNGKIIFSII